MKANDKFLKKIEAFRKRYGLTATGFGVAAGRGTSFVRRVNQELYKPKPAIIEQTLNWMFSYEEGYAAAKSGLSVDCPEYYYENNTNAWKAGYIRHERDLDRRAHHRDDEVVE
jgi:hypothetical protein